MLAQAPSRTAPASRLPSPPVLLSTPFHTYSHRSVLPHRWTQLDASPDAAACRLHLTLATAASQASMRCPWGLEHELIQYLDQRAYVSAACRLSVDDERRLLEKREAPAQTGVGRCECVGGRARRSTWCGRQFTEFWCEWVEERVHHVDVKVESCDLGGWFGGGVTVATNVPATSSPSMQVPGCKHPAVHNRRVVLQALQASPAASAPVTVSGLALPPRPEGVAGFDAQHDDTCLRGPPGLLDLNQLQVWWGGQREGAQPW
eukprot:354839-Chlamydomonas_euryale.AAC.2